MNKKLVVVSIVLFGLLLVSSTLLFNYYTQYKDLKKIIESELINTNKKDDIYERIILQYEFMDFKIGFTQFFRSIQHKYHRIAVLYHFNTSFYTYCLHLILTFFIDTCHIHQFNR